MIEGHAPLLVIAVIAGLLLVFLVVVIRRHRRRAASTATAAIDAPAEETRGAVLQEWSHQPPRWRRGLALAVGVLVPMIMVLVHRVVPERTPLVELAAWGLVMVAAMVAFALQKGAEAWRYRLTDEGLWGQKLKPGSGAEQPAQPWTELARWARVATVRVGDRGAVLHLRPEAEVAPIRPGRATRGMARVVVGFPADRSDLALLLRDIAISQGVPVT